MLGGAFLTAGAVGVSGFESMTDLRNAIEEADRVMYGRRQEIRGAKTVSTTGAPEVTKT